MDKFAQQINAAQRGTEALNQGIIESSSLEKSLLVRAFHQLYDALAELRVTHDELSNQKEQLVNYNRRVELECQRYHNLFYFAPEAYFTTDIHGNILDANHAAITLFQVSQSNLVNKSLIDFLPEYQHYIFHTQLRRLPHEKILKDWEIFLCKANGQSFLATISVSIVENVNNQLNLNWIIRDTTFKKQAEEARVIQSQNIQVQEASVLKSQFLAMMSHELRTPMHVILGFAQLLLRQPYQLLAPQLKNMVERIFNNAKHLLALIEDILDFTALESNKLTLNSHEFNLAELVQAVVQQMQHLASRKKLSLIVDIQLEYPITLGDSDRVRQIIVNLVDNAIKFTDKGSVILEVYEEAPLHRIVIVVRDTGIGISQNDIKYIFQEFRQIDQTYSRRHGGTGLGLAIVDKLVKLMQGTIRVESQLGEGSTFRVELPR
jgi:PAS domain S-box-containing protein